MSELLKLLPKKIKISYADVSIETESNPTFLEECYGEYSSQENKITIASTISDADIANTLIHEIIHACVWYGGLKDDGAELEEDKKEERVVNVIANQLSQILRDNPKILTVIKKGLTKKYVGSKKRNETVALSQKILEKYTFHKNRK